MHEIYLATIGGCIAMIGYGLCGFFAKLNLFKLSGIKVLFWMQFITTLCLILGVLFFGYSFKFEYSKFFILFFISVIDIAGYLFYYYGLKQGKASIILPLLSTFSIFSTFISITCFGEPITIKRLLILNFIILGIFLISLKKDTFLGIKSFKLNSLQSGVVPTLISVFLFAIWYPIWDRFIYTTDSWIDSLISYKLVLVLNLLIVLKLTGIAFGLPKNESQNKYYFSLFIIILLGLFNFIADLGVAIGLKFSSYTSITTILLSSGVFITVLLAHIFLKERLSIFQKLGIVFIFLGTIFLNIG